MVKAMLSIDDFIEQSKRQGFSKPKKPLRNAQQTYRQRKDEAEGALIELSRVEPEYDTPELESLRNELRK
jgi:hypothetical protein